MRCNFTGASTSTLARLVWDGSDSDSGGKHEARQGGSKMNFCQKSPSDWMQDAASAFSETRAPQDSSPLLAHLPQATNSLSRPSESIRRAASPLPLVSRFSREIPTGLHVSVTSCVGHTLIRHYATTSLSFLKPSSTHYVSPTSLTVGLINPILESLPAFVCARLSFTTRRFKSVAACAGENTSYPERSIILDWANTHHDDDFSSTALLRCDRRRFQSVLDWKSSIEICSVPHKNTVRCC